MPCALSWLDFSVDDQRRAREIVALFTQRESRDELEELKLDLRPPGLG